MRYRQFGRLDWQVSALGFGCMRLPTIGDDRTKIDEPEATRMLHYAIDHGVNYLDTAYPYHGGSSERLLGQALQGGYRQKVRLATKLPTWLVEAAGDLDKFLDEQLQRLQTEHIDYYLLHGLNQNVWHKMRDLGVLERAEVAIADGRIGHLGFSFHDRYEALVEIVGGYDCWALCQIQYNYMDVEEQAGTRGLQYAAGKGLAVVIMEPLLGGRLVNPPAPIQALWDSAGQRRTPAGWALAWLWSQPEVSVVLSGMSAMAQVVENVAGAERSAIGALSAEELALVDKVRAAYRALCPIPCTRCEYCLPCTNNLNIPRLFEIFNSGRIYNKLAEARRHYARLSPEEQASACTQCRQCEERCPQSIPISEWMGNVHAVLAEGQPYENCRLP